MACYDDTPIGSGEYWRLHHPVRPMATASFVEPQSSHSTGACGATDKLIEPFERVTFNLRYPFGTRIESP